MSNLAPTKHNPDRQTARKGTQITGKDIRKGEKTTRKQEQRGNLYGITTYETEAAGRDDPPRLFRQTYIFHRSLNINIFDA